MADGPFTAYAFQSIPSNANTVARTMPERLSDIINVKEFGAVGDGIADDSAAINAAIDYAWAYMNAGATVYFPPGTYLISSAPLLLDRDPATKVPPGRSDLVFAGAGRDVSIITGNYSTGNQPSVYPQGFLVVSGYWDQQLSCIRDLTIRNESTVVGSGALIMNSAGSSVIIDNCHFHGVIGLVMQNNQFASSIRNCIFTCSIAISDASAATLTPLFNFTKFPQPPNPQVFTGSVGVYFAGSLINCRVEGFDIGMTAEGVMGSAIGSYFSRCGIGLATGHLCGSYTIAASNAPQPQQWFFLNSNMIHSNHFDRCTWGIMSYILAASAVTSCRVSGTVGPYNSATISGMSWNLGSHVVTVDTVDNHNITDGSTVVIVDTNNQPLTGWTTDAKGFVTATVTGVKQFTYPGPAVAPPAFVSGAWNYPLQYAITMKGSGGNLWAAHVLEAAVTFSFDMASTYWAGGSKSNSLVWSIRGPYGFQMDTTNEPDGFSYLQCGVAGSSPPAGFLFSQLPPQLGDPSAVKGPFDGQTFNIITDCQLQNEFAGDVVAGGSTNHYKLRYNSVTSTWKRIG